MIGYLAENNDIIENSNEKYTEINIEDNTNNYNKNNNDINKNNYMNDINNKFIINKIENLSDNTNNEKIDLNKIKSNTNGRFGRTYTFFFKNGEPLIVIGPHCNKNNYLNY
jgi:hypothetical protein